ncbi:hypothetical protein GJ744_011339 [Endocarpon pusillum]|uniref:Uncharacterized protein n=1 Tax=Endocarpon pusillum TaxID=364733 RepID=A0A8H7E9D2_9EURO|nr:hypothetical protein GJ744_011339 [Endocarpon pusillum]
MIDTRYQATLPLPHDSSAIITLDPSMTEFEEVESPFPPPPPQTSDPSSLLLLIPLPTPKARHKVQTRDEKCLRVAYAKLLLSG